MHFGVAPSRSHYYFESGARRYGYEKEDFDKQFAKSRVDPSSGKRLSGFITQEWDQDAEGRLNCAVDVTELANRLKRSGKAEVKLSDDAGELRYCARKTKSLMPTSRSLSLRVHLLRLDGLRKAKCTRIRSEASTLRTYTSVCPA